MLLAVPKFGGHQTNFRSASQLRLLFPPKNFGDYLSSCRFSMFDHPASFDRGISSAP